MVRELGAASSTAEQGGLRAVFEALADAGNSGRGKEWDGTNTVVGAGGWARGWRPCASHTDTADRTPAIGKVLRMDLGPVLTAVKLVLLSVWCLACRTRVAPCSVARARARTPRYIYFTLNFDTGVVKGVCKTRQPSGYLTSKCMHMCMHMHIACACACRHVHRIACASMCMWLLTYVTRSLTRSASTRRRCRSVPVLRRPRCPRGET